MKSHVKVITTVGGIPIPPCVYCQTQHTYLLDIMRVWTGRTFHYICREDCIKSSRVLGKK